MGFLISWLNSCMKIDKKLTPAQFDIQRLERRDNGYTNWWLRQVGINYQYLTIADSRLIHAQNKAHLLLKNHLDLLTESQIKTLKSFKRRMGLGHLRKKLRPEAANAVFKINTKIQRLIHRQTTGT